MDLFLSYALCWACAITGVPRCKFFSQFVSEFFFLVFFLRALHDVSIFDFISFLFTETKKRRKKNEKEEGKRGKTLFPFRFFAPCTFYSD